jgi:uncharacterized membrane protein YesL
MEQTGWTGRLYSSCQWISRLAFVNLLWLLFSALGLVVLGAAPSTVAMFAVIRKWVQGETNIPVFSLFWQTFKQEFLKANFLGILLLSAAIILYLDWRLISSVQGALNPILTGCLMGVAFLFLIVLLYIFPVYVHYDYTVFQYIKTAFLIGISHPVQTLGLLFGLMMALVIGFFFQGIGILYFGSGLGYFLMYLSNSIFMRIGQQAKMQEA